MCQAGDPNQLDGQKKMLTSFDFAPKGVKKVRTLVKHREERENVIIGWRGSLIKKIPSSECFVDFMDLL